MENTRVQRFFICQHQLHCRLVGLRQQTAATVKNRRNARSPVVGRIHKKSPVAVVPIKIAQQRINDKHAPEKSCDCIRRNKLLQTERFFEIDKLRTTPLMRRIDHRIFDRAEIVKDLSAPLFLDCKIPAGANDLCFAADHISPQQGFLRIDPEKAKNPRTNVFAKAAIGIGKSGRFVFCRRRKLQHIDSALANDGDLFAVRTVVSLVQNAPAGCKIDGHCSSFFPQRNFWRK